MAGKRKTVLVVDDEPVVRDLVHTLLSHFGHEVRTAHSAEDALAKLDEAEFDLVLTDFLMPEMKGDELAREIKKRKPSMPIVLLTGHRPEIIAPEVSYVLPKPFTRDELCQAIAALT